MFYLGDTGTQANKSIAFLSTSIRLFSGLAFIRIFDVYPGVGLLANALFIVELDRRTHKTNEETVNQTSNMIYFDRFGDLVIQESFRWTQKWKLQKATKHYPSKMIAGVLWRLYTGVQDTVDIATCCCSVVTDILKVWFNKPSVQTKLLSIRWSQVFGSVRTEPL